MLLLGEMHNWIRIWRNSLSDTFRFRTQIQFCELGKSKAGNKIRLSNVTHNSQTYRSF